VKLGNPFISQVTSSESWTLPSLDDFRYGPLETSELPDASVLSTEPSEPREDEDEGVDSDIWALALELPDTYATRKFLSWEAFQGSQEEDVGSAYMSEWGPGAFDAAVRLVGHRFPSPQRMISNGTVAKRDVAIKAFYDLGLGRSSVLFRYDERKRIFSTTMTNFTVMGYSQAVCDSLFRDFADFGATIRRLGHFAERSYAANAFSGRVALANSIFTVLSSLELHLATIWPQLQSIIQVQGAFERPRIILQHFKMLVRNVSRCRTDEQLSSALFEHCQAIQDGEEWLLQIMFQILSAVSRPLLDRISTWTGLSTDQSSTWSLSYQKLAFIRPLGSSDDASVALEETDFEPSQLPSFISPEMGVNLYDTGYSLRLLQFHHPDHPLSKRSLGTSLEWALTWEDVDAAAQKGRKFKNQVEDVADYMPILDVVQESQSIAFDNDGINIEERLTKSIQQLDQYPLQEAATESSLAIQVRSSLQPSLTSTITFSPPISLLPSLSFTPLLSAQSRLIKTTVLRLLFSSHALRTHLRVQKAFFLFGDGTFVSRLTTALFDTDTATAERQTGVLRGAAAGMGMRVGGRETWPPASSEVRLALTGILSECFMGNKGLRDGFGKRKNIIRDSDVLPGGLSFTIRQDCPESMVDPHTLPALDFLKLTYSPDSPVDVVLSERSMSMYDELFKFLLKLVRSLFVVGQLPRTFPRSKNPKRSTIDVAMMRMSMQARHFVESLASHLFDRVIGGAWKEFEKKLDVVEQQLSKDDASPETSTRDGYTLDIPSLRSLHESALSDMIKGLFLQNRQKQLKEQLDAMLSDVLEAEKLAYEIQKEEEVHGSWSSRIETLSRGMNEHIKTFLSSCRDTPSKSKVPGMDELVRTVDWNGFYGVCTDE
jgi:hypothetical protein